MEALPRRRDVGSVRLPRRRSSRGQDSPAVGTRQRCRSGVDRRHGLFPIGPQRRVQPVLVRAADQSRHAADASRRLPRALARRRRRPRGVRTGRLSPLVGSRGEDQSEADHRRRRRSRGDPAALRQRREVRAERGAVAVWRTRGVRLPRRDRHRACGKRRRAQPDRHGGHSRAQPGVVAGWEADRVLLRRIGRIRARRRAAGRQGRAQALQAGRRRLLRTSGLGARQPEALVRRQFVQRVLRRSRVRRDQENRERIHVLADQDVDNGVVARFAVARVHAEQPLLRSDGARLFARSGRIVPDHRRAQRSERAGLRQERQVHVLLRVDRRRSGEELVLAGQRRLARHQLDLRRGAPQGRSVAAAEGKRRGEGSAGKGREKGRQEGRARAEWAQMFEESWRINRDYFYDPGMHGNDWKAVRAKYEPFVAHLAVREDLTRLMQWMLSELSVGHSRETGGETLADPKTVPGGLLGADYTIENGRYRFKKVYGGLNWNPQLRAPLTEPGVNVKADEYLFAVNGREPRSPTNLYSLFENTSGKIVEITVGPNADGTGSRTVAVVPIANEAALRNRDWVESNIRKVDAATGGKVAYFYVPDTAGQGFTYFKRYFYPQTHKEAATADEPP